MLNKMLQHLCILAAAAAMLFTSSHASAVPSFGRQTGQSCAACHTVFPELNAFGRQFKLRGYALGGALDESGFALPLAASLIASRTATSTRAADPQEDFPRANKTILQTAALYYAGKITDDSGAFVQYGYDGIERRWAIEMADIRYAASAMFKDRELLWGLTLNNAPTVQDVWNTMTTWAFPHLDDAGVMPPVSTILDMPLSQQVGGLGWYGLWDNTLYGELSFYRTTNTGLLRPLGQGVPTTTVVKGYNPYWHIMYNQEMGIGSFAAGVRGMTADIYPDPNNLSGPTDRYRDISVDAQYQYIGDPHIFSATAAWIREKRDWRASFPLMAASNPSGTLNTFKLGLHYWYLRKAGGGIGYFSTSGDTDMLAYGGMGAAQSAMANATGSPDTKGWIAEVDWLPLNDMQNLKLGLRYTAYTRFNGAGTNYNGFGRNASGNNKLFLYAWWLL